MKHPVFANWDDKSIFLSVYIMQEMVNPKGAFGRYIDFLESEDSSQYPLCFEETTLKKLEGSPILKALQDRKDHLELCYTAICKAAPDFDQFSFKEFL